MTEKDDHSVIVNIPRPRAFPIRNSTFKVKNNICKRFQEKVIKKPSESSLRKYSLHEDTILRAQDFQNDCLLLSQKFYTKLKTKLKHMKRLKIKIHEKYKIINTDVRNRLHVDHPPHDVIAVTDIDESFYRLFDSRPVAQYIPLYKSLKYMFHMQLRMIQEVGYRHDCILNIEVNHRREELAYEKSFQRYAEQVKLFEAFISEDYMKSMAYLKKADSLAAKANAKIYELQNLANKQFAIQSRLINLDYLYITQQKYGRFLYYLSPPSWRSRNREFAHSVEIEAKGFDLGTSSEEDTFNVLFDNMQNECLSGLVKPALYFSSPTELISIFENMAKQQLHHFSYVIHLAPHTKTLKQGIQTLKTTIENESTWHIRQIRDLKILLEFLETRESQLQSKFMKILHGLFYDSVAATDVLKLQFHLEFCYEKLYREKSQHISLLANAKAVEDMYMVFSFKLDAVHGSQVKSYMKKCNECEKMKIRKALQAANELRMFNNLERALLRACEPIKMDKPHPTNIIPHKLPKKNTKRKVPPKSDEKKTSNQRELTEAEVEYLTLFTEWNEHEEPAKYLKSL